MASLIAFLGALGCFEYDKVAEGYACLFAAHATLGIGFKLDKIRKAIEKRS